MPFRGRTRRLIACALTLAFALVAPGAAADEAQQLLEAINDYRRTAHDCAGERRAGVSPLAPSEALARATGGSAEALREALDRAGEPAAAVQQITLSGPQDAGAAMRLLVRQYCRTLGSARFSQIGISRDGGTWRIAFAQPLLDRNLGDWRAAGKAVLEHVNKARSESRTCGGRRFDSAQPLEWDDRLAAAALAHSREMAQHDFFAHAGRNGGMVAQRVSSQGYKWRRVGENIAAGQGSAQQVVSGWLSSPHHCANIMDPGFREMGAAYAIELKSRRRIYWTQVFAVAP